MGRRRGEGAREAVQASYGCRPWSRRQLAVLTGSFRPKLVKICHCQLSGCALNGHCGDVMPTDGGMAGASGSVSTTVTEVAKPRRSLWPGPVDTASR